MLVKVTRKLLSPIDTELNICTKLRYFEREIWTPVTDNEEGIFKRRLHPRPVMIRPTDIPLLMGAMDAKA